MNISNLTSSRVVLLRPPLPPPRPRVLASLPRDGPPTPRDLPHAHRPLPRAPVPPPGVHLSGARDLLRAVLLVPLELPVLRPNVIFVRNLNVPIMM